MRIYERDVRTRRRSRFEVNLLSHTKFGCLKVAIIITYYFYTIHQTQQQKVAIRQQVSMPLILSTLRADSKRANSATNSSNASSLFLFIFFVLFLFYLSSLVSLRQLDIIKGA